MENLRRMLYCTVREFESSLISAKCFYISTLFQFSLFLQRTNLRVNTATYLRNNGDSLGVHGRVIGRGFNMLLRTIQYVHFKFKFIYFHNSYIKSTKHSYKTDCYITTLKSNKSNHAKCIYTYQKKQRN